MPDETKRCPECQSGAINITARRSERRWAGFRVWWHCLRLVGVAGHQHCTMRENLMYRRFDFCRCGYNGDGPYVVVPLTDADREALGQQSLVEPNGASRGAASTGER